MDNKMNEETNDFPILTGQCILDERSIQLIENKIREELINEIIKNKDMDSDECVEIMKMFAPWAYLSIIRQSIDTIIEKCGTDENPSCQDKKHIAQLKAIKSIILI